MPGKEYVFRLLLWQQLTTISICCCLLSVNHLDCKMSEDNKKKMVSMTFTSLGSPSVLTFDWLEPVNVCFFFWTDKWPEQLSVSALLHII